MAAFIGTYENRVDRKGRVSVPASFRQVLAKTSANVVVAHPSHRVPAIEAYDQDFAQRLNDCITEFDLFSEQQDDLASIIFGDSRELAIDSDGRIVLPQIFSEAVGITDRAAFVGKGPVFQIWEPQALTAHKEAARQRARERGFTLPLKRRRGDDS